MIKMIKPIVNLSKIAEDFDTFVFGFNGVLYDGKHCFPEVADCLRNLNAAGKKIVVISNMALRIEEIVGVLQKNNIPLKIFSNIVTAGEILHYKFKAAQNEFAALGESYFHLGNKNEKGVFSDLSLHEAKKIEQAHFLYMSSSNGADDTIETYRPLLEHAVSLGLPFVCAGNDTSNFINGKLCLAPGALAEAYAVMGGRIITVGKPDISILKYALEGISSLEKSIIVGDNIATDIKMASLAGCSSVLISKGRHVNYLGEGYIPDIAKGRELSNSYDVSPDCIISSVRW